LAGKLIKKNIIYQIHESSIKPKFLKLFLEFINSKTSSANIYVSNYLYNNYKYKDVKNIIHEVIYNCLNEEFEINSYNFNYNAFSKDFKILMISSLKIYKGILQFLEIARLFEENNV
jgi:glycosyltransferase involved in cell wall biosynthesis